ncbi:hypothetical protein QBC37DRAFT_389027 [Rhypophila decipiens]|uniref:Uncharacterized protein n=1 Tax=Rhypophila decipiens TaxID=261697 RepID=A0AAN6Y4T6_9PEZI|nr:hypothetical protein QBC37DRAFT_389027 [Rhypophila decipiens]
MPITSVDLGTTTACRVQQHQAASSFISLTLSTSGAIDIPSDFIAETPDTALEPSRIARAWEDGALWVSKAGSCRLDFAVVLVNGEEESLDSVINDKTLSRICSSIAELQVWQDTGLHLRDRHSEDSNSDSDIATTWEEKNSRTQTSSSYFLQHPDLSSDIHAPPSVPCAIFHGLACQIKLQFKNAGHATATTNSGQRSERPAHDHKYNLRRKAHPTSKAGGELAHVENPDTAAVLGNLPSSERGEPRIHEEKESLASGGEIQGFLDGQTVPERAQSDSSPMDIAQEIEELLDATLRRLIGVGKGGLKGIKVTRQLGQRSLIAIAPAVWNLRYLQSVTAHAQLIPSLASSIARLQNSRSASLRDKVGRITGQQQPTQDDIVDEATQRLWRLCQTQIRPRPALRGSGTQTENVRAVVSHKPAGSQPSFEQQETRMMEFPHYWEHIGALHEGTRSSDEADSDSEVWQAGWLDPFESEMDEERNVFTPGGSFSDIDSELVGYGSDTDDGEEEASVGEYFYADGQGNVFAIDVGDEEGSEEDHDQRSLESDWDNSASSVSEAREEGSDEYFAVEHYPGQHELWLHHH